MHIYDKQCEIMKKKPKWKGSNGQLQCFYKGTLVTSAELSAENGCKLGKLKRPFLKFFKYYDPPRVAPCRRAWPGLSENV